MYNYQDLEQLDDYLLLQLRKIEKAEDKTMPAIQSAIQSVQKYIDILRGYDWNTADMIEKLLGDACCN